MPQVNVYVSWDEALWLKDHPEFEKSEPLRKAVQLAMNTDKSNDKKGAQK